MKVLVVEQEPHRRAAISECLGKNGYAVIEAADSRAALTTLEHSSGVRVVVADIDMSDPPSGLAFAFEVHHRWPELGMVITSGHVRHLRPEEVPGGAYFVPRPLPIWMLRELVWLASHNKAEVPVEPPALVSAPIYVH